MSTLGSGGCRPGQKVTCCCQLVRKSPWMTAPSPKGRPAHRRGAEQKGQPGMTALRCARSAGAAARLRSQQPAAHRHGRGWPPLLSRKRRWPQRSAQQSTARTFHVKEHGCQTLVVTPAWIREAACERVPRKRRRTTPLAPETARPLSSCTTSGPGRDRRTTAMT